MINDVLDFSKIEAGAGSIYEMVNFNLRDCLETTLKTLAVRADEKSLELLCEIAPRSAGKTWKAIPRGCARCLLNLVGNAIKFTPAGRDRPRSAFENTGGNEKCLGRRSSGNT